MANDREEYDYILPTPATSTADQADDEYSYFSPLYWNTKQGKAKLEDGMFVGDTFMVNAADEADATPVYSQGERQDLSGVPDLKPSSVDLSAGFGNRFMLNMREMTGPQSFGRALVQPLAKQLTGAAGYDAEAADAAVNRGLAGTEREFVETRPWYDAPTTMQQLSELTAAIGGSVAGTVLDPTSAIGGVGKTFGQTFLRNAVPNALGDIFTQASNIDAGIQQEYDPNAEFYNPETQEFETEGPAYKAAPYSPLQTAIAFGLGGLIPALPQTPQLVRTISERMAQARQARIDAAAANPLPNGAAAPVPQYSEDLATALADPQVAAVLRANGIDPADPRFTAEALSEAGQKIEERLRAAGARTAAQPRTPADTRSKSPQAAGREVAGEVLRGRQREEAIAAGEVDPGFDPRAGAVREPVPGVIRLGQQDTTPAGGTATRVQGEPVGSAGVGAREGMRQAGLLDLDGAQRAEIEKEFGFVPPTAEMRLRMWRVLERERGAQAEADAKGAFRTSDAAASQPEGNLYSPPSRPVSEGVAAGRRLSAGASENRAAPRSPTDTEIVSGQPYARPASGTSDRPFRAVDDSTDNPAATRAFEDQQRQRADQMRAESIEDIERQWDRMRKKRAEDAGARTEYEERMRRAGERYNKKQTSSNKPGAPDRDGRWPIDDSGFVLSNKGGPIRFADQKQAAKWILNEGQRKSPDQNFEIHNHPVGDGFTVREHSRTAKPGAAGQRDGAGDAGAGGGNKTDAAQGPSGRNSGEPKRIGSGDRRSEPSEPEAGARRAGGEDGAGIRQEGGDASVRADDVGPRSGGYGPEQRRPLGEDPLDESALKPTPEEEAAFKERFAEDGRPVEEGTPDASFTRKGFSEDDEKFRGVDKSDAWPSRGEHPLDRVFKEAGDWEAKHVGGEMRPGESKGDAADRVWREYKKKYPGAIRVNAYSDLSGDAFNVRVYVPVKDLNPDESAVLSARKINNLRFSSNPFLDPEMWAPALRREMAGIKKDMETLDRAFKAKSKTKVFQALGDVAQTIGSSVRGFAYTLRNRYAKAGNDKAAKIIGQIIDNLATDPGTGRYVAEPYEWAVNRLSHGFTNRLGNILASIPVKDLESFGSMVAQGKKMTGVMAEVAPRLRKLLDEYHAYADKELKAAAKDRLARATTDAEKKAAKADLDAAGLGYTKNYFPRMLDEEAVRANAVDFQRDAASAYRKYFGMSAEDARKAALEWFERELGVGRTSFRHAGISPDASKSRVLPAQADALLDKWYVRDPYEALQSYFHRTTRFVEFTKRFGKNGEKLDGMFDDLVRAGVADRDISSLQLMVDSALGSMQRHTSSVAGSAVSWLQTIGIMRLLPRAVWSSIAEPMAYGARTGNAMDGLRALSDTFRQVFSSNALRDQRDIAEMFGIWGKAATEMMLESRFGGGNMTNFQRFALARFFHRSGLEALTNKQRIAGVRLMQDYIARLVRDTADAARATSSKQLLAELGIGEKELPLVRKLITGKKGRVGMADLLGDSEAAQAYTQAINRGIDEAIQNPKAVDRPIFANHPYGRLAYGIMSFMYSFTRNVLYRNAKQVSRAVSDPSLTYADRAQLAVGPAMGLFGLLTAQYTMAQWRDKLTNPTEAEERPKELSFLQYLSRAGVFGNLDPVINATLGARYERDFSGLLGGAYLSQYMQDLQRMSGLLPEPFGKNSDRTNTAEWNATRAAYNAIAVPAMSFGLSMAPGGPLLNVGYGALLASPISPLTPEASSAAATAIAGERPKRWNYQGGRGNENSEESEDTGDAEGSERVSQAAPAQPPATQLAAAEPVVQKGNKRYSIKRGADGEMIVEALA